MDSLILHIRKGVLSTKLIPAHLPKSTFLMNIASGIATSFSVPQSGYMRQLLERNDAYVCRSFPDRNVSDNDNQGHEKVS